MLFMSGLRGVSAYSTLEEYAAGAVRRMSAPLSASMPTWLMNCEMVSLPEPPYICENA